MNTGRAWGITIGILIEFYGILWDLNRILWDFMGA
jgi:hypothetical protein